MSIIKNLLKRSVIEYKRSGLITDPAFITETRKTEIMVTDEILEKIKDPSIGDSDDAFEIVTERKTYVTMHGAPEYAELVDTKSVTLTDRWSVRTWGTRIYNEDCEPIVIDWTKIREARVEWSSLS